MVARDRVVAAQAVDDRAVVLAVKDVVAVGRKDRCDKSAFYCE